MFGVLGMVQDRFVARDRLFPLPAVGLKDFVDRFALHTLHKRVKLIGSMPYTEHALQARMRRGHADQHFCTTHFGSPLTTSASVSRCCPRCTLLWEAHYVARSGSVRAGID